MVKAAQPWYAHQLCRRQCSALDGAAVRRVLLERVVDSILMVIRHVVPQVVADVLRSTRFVQQLTAATPDPSFCDSILPRCLNARALRLKAAAFQRCDHLPVEFRVMVQNHVPVRLRFRESLPQLLLDPVGGGMCGHVEVQNPAAPMLDHKQTVQ
jgi:hypothetical protein